MRNRRFKGALVVAALSAFSSMASAGLLVPPSPVAGNDCSGVFGQGFEDCKIPANIDPNESPIIIKFNFNEDVPGEIEINSRCFRRSTAANSPSPASAPAPGLGHTHRGRAIRGSISLLRRVDPTSTSSATSAIRIPTTGLRR